MLANVADMIESLLSDIIKYFSKMQNPSSQRYEHDGTHLTVKKAKQPYKAENFQSALLPPPSLHLVCNLVLLKFFSVSAAHLLKPSGIYLLLCLSFSIWQFSLPTVLSQVSNPTYFLWRN